MKTMKKNIVLKLLTGVVTTAITATGIAVPMMAGSGRDREDVSVIDDEAIEVAEVVVDTEIIGDGTSTVDDYGIDVTMEYGEVTEDEVAVEDEAIVEDETVTEGDAVKEEAESAKTGSAKTESAKTGSAKTESAETGSAKTESAKTGSAETESAETGSTETGSAKPESTETAPAQSESVHKHNWTAHKGQRWVSQIVTVVDEPERYEEYSIYMMYWYNTGTWEETRDPDRFREWSNSEYGALYPFFHLAKFEDSPLFLGYDELGHASYLGDHSIRSGYDLVPAVTHEEDRGHYETYVDYYYCDCGAMK